MAVVVAVLGIAVGGGVLVALFLTTAGADQARVTVEGGDLVVRPVGAMGFWSLSKGVRVPLSSVVSVAPADRRSLPLGFRSPGSYWPGMVCAGTYRKRGSKGLWMVGRADQVLDIELRGEAYTRVVVQVADPAATVAEVQAASGG